MGAGREGSLEAAPPENVRGSGESGTPDQQAEKAADNANNEFMSSVENGMDPHEAESTARQNHLFPPDEEDQPHLGESPISSQDPTNLETTTVLPKQTRSRKRRIVGIH